MATDNGIMLGFYIFTPMLLYLLLERGLMSAIVTLVDIIFRLSPLFYAFQTGL